MCFGPLFGSYWELSSCSAPPTTPLTDGQTEVTNKTLGVLLRTLVQKNLREWDLKLSHAEFAFNRSPSAATKISPFECVYGVNPLLPTALINLPGLQTPPQRGQGASRELTQDT